MHHDRVIFNCSVLDSSEWNNVNFIWMPYKHIDIGHHMTILSTYARFKLPRKAFFYCRYSSACRIINTFLLAAPNYIKIIFLTLHTHQNSCSVFRFCCSLTAEPVQNIPVLCWGQLEPQQSIRVSLPAR